MPPLVLSIFVGSIVAGITVAVPNFGRVALFGVVAFLILAVATARPDAAFVILLIWLAGFGLLRRLLLTVSVLPALGDPLVLVGPLVLILLAIMAWSRGAFAQRTKLSNAVAALTAILTASAFNPQAGGLAAGLSGWLVVVPPMLSFWIARSLMPEMAIRRVFRVLIGLALPAALYGLYQTLHGFPSWDATWIAQSGYTALNVGRVTRAFSSFASGAEYAGFLAVGLASLLATDSHILRRVTVLPFVAILGAALWLESSRGIIVAIVLAAAMLGAARLGVGPGRALLLGAGCLLAIPLVVGTLLPAGSDPGSDLVNHQVQGLSDPLGQSSTLGVHLDLVTQGVLDSVHNPLGVGVGAISSATGKFGGQARGTEADPGNAAVAGGLLGLVAYTLVLIRGLSLAFSVARSRTGGTLGRICLVVLVVTFPQWLNGGQYSIAPLPWLVMGWLDRVVPKSNHGSLAEHAISTRAQDV